MTRHVPLRTHATLRRSAIKRGPSKKQRAKLRAYDKSREAVMVRCGGSCEFPMCHRPATETHHRRLRSQGGSHAVNNLIALCDEHHDWIHRNPALAAQRGLILRRSVEGGPHVAA